MESKSVARERQRSEKDSGLITKCTIILPTERITKIVFLHVYGKPSGKNFLLHIT